MKNCCQFIVALITFLPLNIFAWDTIESKTKSMDKFPGYFTYYWDDNSGNIYLEISEFNKEFLLVNAISEGLGSNDIGFDRGKLDRERVVFLKRVGPKVLLVQPNYYYRAESNDANEKQAIRESFAKSVLWGFKVEAESGGKVLVDLTPFLISDNQFLSRYLANIQQGTFQIDGERCAVNLQRTKNFQENSEFDALITFSGADPGNYVRDVAPTAQSFTIHQHLSFIQLPDDKYKRRVFDPRSGFFGISFQDYATPVDQPLTKQFIARHRLEKVYPDREKSPVKEPIIYYLDNGTPEPVRSALLDGASWWKEAFEAAGFENAFEVRILPDDADPMDVRYNVIQWVHRATRGWSYGNAVIDPRSGEILKGHVSLGSLRVRQDFLIAEGLLAPYASGSENTAMQQMALARLRQLSAHEVGHTLGLMHNFAASYNDRASVMDYPHPLIRLKNGNSIDLSDAYDSGIGDWDKVAIRYGYSEYNGAEEEKRGLQNIIDEYITSGIKYISDSDARPAGGAHPYAHLWENGTDPAGELQHILKVRTIALNNFSDNVIRQGTPYAELENALVPVYLMHRYAVDAASKVVGGLEYSYAVRGDGQIITRFVDPALQQEAFKALVMTLDPTVLLLNEKLLKILPPHPPGYPRTRESFASKTDLTFDPLSAAETAIDITLLQIFNSARIARIIQYQQRDKNNPSIRSFFKIYFDKVFEQEFTAGLAGEIQCLLQSRSVDFMILLEKDPGSPSYVKTWAYHMLEEWREWFAEQAADLDSPSPVRDHYIYMRVKIDDYFRDPGEYHRQNPVVIPPGSPIGCGGY